jgi:hypothetical protein
VELYNLSSSSNIRMIKWQDKKCMRSFCLEILSEGAAWKAKNNIEVDLKRTREGVDRMYLALGKV